jgi:ABC-type Mn2+/Zn2+ transport system permease subunit
LGLALLNRYGQAKKSIEAVLFGSVLGVETADIIAVSAVSVFTAVIIFALYRHFLFATFDPEVAQTSGVKVAWIEALLMAMLSLTILVTMRVIGTLLISALLVIPASVARMTTNSFARMLWISPIIGAVSASLGMYLSYHLDTSASATIILVGTTMFIVVYAFTGLRGRSRIAHLHHV